MKVRKTRAIILWILVGLSVGSLVRRNLEIWANPASENTPTDVSSKLSPSFVVSHVRGADLQNQNYTWEGRQWIVPSSSGIPVFSQHDMLQAFANMDTLWLGDSTTRRAYATMYFLLNHTNASTGSNGTIPISIAGLNNPAVIDVNRFAHKGIVQETSCDDRKAHAKSTYFKPGMHNIWNSYGLCRRLPRIQGGGGEGITTTATSTTTTTSGAIFDYARVDCFTELTRVAELEEELKRYSLIIVGLGLHDALGMHACVVPIPRVKIPFHEIGNLSEAQIKERSKSKGNMPVEDVFDKYGWKGVQDIATTLQYLHGSDQSNYTSTRTAVLWRTVGFSASGGSTATRKILDMNQMAKDSVADRRRQQQNDETDLGYLGIIDWGTAIYPRSFPPNRIDGDIAAHYGAEARLLMAQMTTQQIFNFLLTFDGVH